MCARDICFGPLSVFSDQLHSRFHSQEDGGAIDALHSSVHVNATTFSGNTATFGGGAVIVDESTLEITDSSSFSENEAEVSRRPRVKDESGVYLLF